VNNADGLALPSASSHTLVSVMMTAVASTLENRRARPGSFQFCQIDHRPNIPQGSKLDAVLQ